ncbi:MAG TPA: vWA domain-containing protein [Solirubrobacteraceae bacterium]|jgi:hypothetical protein
MRGPTIEKAVVLMVWCAFIVGALIVVFDTGVASAAGTAPDCVVPGKLGVALVLDDSGSMVDNDPANLRGAAAGIGIDTLPDGSLVSGSKFTDTATRLFDPTELSAANRPALKQAIAAGLQSSGDTDYDAAFTEGQQQLVAMPGADKRAVVFLSDGEPNFPYTADQPIDAAGIPIFAVGFGQVGAGELAGIARRSGGQAFSLRSAADAPSVFGRIVSTLNCDIQQSDVDVSLKPGQTRVFPFTVEPGQPGFHALVTWLSGALDVSLVRPDKSVLAIGKARPNESIEVTPTSADATVKAPPPGRWKVRLHAPKSAVKRVRLHLELWARESPGTTTGEDPFGPPKPSGGRGCQYKLSLGAIQVEASCLTISHNVAKATGRIRVDGLDVAPAGNAGLSLNLKTLELRSSGEVTVAAGPVTLYHGKFDRKLAQLSLPIPAAVGGAVNKLKGLPIQGDASIDFENGVAKIALNASLPDLGNLTGSVTVSASNANGLQLAAASMKLPEATIKGIGVKDASLSYAKIEQGDQWSGEAKIELPSPTVQAIGGGASFINGSFAEAHASIDGNLPIAEAVFLTHVAANLQLHPNFAFGGGLGLSAGPKVLGVRPVGIDGNFQYTSGVNAGDPSDYKISGSVKIVDRLDLANGFVDYRTNGQASLGGDLNLELDGFGFEGAMNGFASASGFQVEGEGTVGYKGHGVGGKGILSSKGAVACGKFFVGYVGFSVKWSDFPTPHPFAGSCDLEGWKVQGSASALLPPGANRPFRVHGHQRMIAFSAVGEGGAPRFTLVSPGGTAYTSPTVDQGLVDAPTSVGLAYPGDSTAYLVLAHPPPGKWTLRVEAGPAVSRFRRAGALPTPKVTGRVHGRGYRRALSFRARRIRGQRLIFYERGNGVGRQIRSTTATHGRIRFTPTDGPAGRRTIVAAVLENGLVRATLNVATFHAPGARRPARVSHVLLRRHGSRVVVTWSKAGGARRYKVHVRVDDGRNQLHTQRGRQLVIRRTTGHRVSVTVQSVSAAGRTGRGRHQTLGARLQRR